MARKRLISPQFFLDGELFDAEQASGLPLRVAYAGLWCFADRRGYLEWKPRELKLGVLPHDVVNMTDTMLALCSHGFLKVYEHPDHPDRLFVAIPSFPKWQTFNIKERPDLHIPEPLTKEHLTSTVPAPFRHGASTPGTGTGTGTNYLPETMRKKPRIARVGKKAVGPPWNPDVYVAAWDRHMEPGMFPFGAASKPLRKLEKLGHAPALIAERLGFYLKRKGVPYPTTPVLGEEWFPAIFHPNFGTFAQQFSQFDGMRKAA